nr:MAG TPA: hypothetical protein [Caudoviricetes sp.]
MTSIVPSSPIAILFSSADPLTTPRASAVARGISTAFSVIRRALPFTFTTSRTLAYALASIPSNLAFSSAV